MTFFSLYLGKQQKPCGKFAKRSFFSLLWRTPNFSRKTGISLSENLFVVMLRSPGKFFWGPFFLEKTCALCPRFLTLASSIPVLGLKRVCPREVSLCLGLGFFSVLGLRGYVLDPTSASYIFGKITSFFCQI